MYSVKLSKCWVWKLFVERDLGGEGRGRGWVELGGGDNLQRMFEILKDLP